MILYTLGEGHGGDVVFGVAILHPYRTYIHPHRTYRTCPVQTCGHAGTNLGRAARCDLFIAVVTFLLRT